MNTAQIKKNAAVAVLFGFGVAAGANAASGGLDFSGITAAVDAGPIITAISAIAAIKVLPSICKWGYNKVIGWFGG